MQIFFRESSPAILTEETTKDAAVTQAPGVGEWGRRRVATSIRAGTTRLLMLSEMLTKMGNMESLPSVSLPCARMLEITSDGWGDGSRRKGSWMTGSVVLCQHTRMGSPTRGLNEDSPIAYLHTFRCHSLGLDDYYDERHMPVTFCHELVRRLLSDRQG